MMPIGNPLHTLKPSADSLEKVVSLEAATRSFHSRRLPGFRPKIGFFIVKSIFEIVKMIRRKFPKFSYI